MAIQVKICGLKTIEAVKAADENGADFLGFVFYPPSQRYITPAEAGIISRFAAAKKVAVVVDASNELLDDIVRNLNPDYIQLHGKESESRAQEIKRKFDLPLIRSVEPNQQPVTNDQQLYDYLLVDSPNGGGSGKAFDWKNFTPPSSAYFLSGGLNSGNIAEAIRITGAKLVDISSGVESERGVKSPQLITKFLAVAQEL